MSKSFDFDIDFRIGSLNWRWRLWRIEPEGEPEHHMLGDVYSSTERAYGGYPELRMGFQSTSPD